MTLCSGLPNTCRADSLRSIVTDELPTCIFVLYILKIAPSSIMTVTPFGKMKSAPSERIFPFAKPIS